MKVVIMIIFLPVGFGLVVSTVGIKCSTGIILIIAGFFLDHTLGRHHDDLLKVNKRTLDE